MTNTELKQLPLIPGERWLNHDLYLSDHFAVKFGTGTSTGASMRSSFGTESTFPLRFEQEVGLNGSLGLSNPERRSEFVRRLVSRG
jgi:hypothetical protein